MVFVLTPEVRYQGKGICVTGQIREYRGRPEMFVTSPAQIVVEREPRSRTAQVSIPPDGAPDSIKATSSV